MSVRKGAEQPLGDYEPLPALPDDPLAGAHEVVSRWIEESLAAVAKLPYYQDIALKSQPAGQQLLAAKPAEAVNFVHAAVLQAQHWDHYLAEFYEYANNAAESVSAQHLPVWNKVLGSRCQAVAALGALMRRSLPYPREVLLAILNWCNRHEQLDGLIAPVTQIARALERYTKETPLDGELNEAMHAFASRLQVSRDTVAMRLGTNVVQLCEKTAAPQLPADLPAPQPATAGAAGVLEPLKRRLGMLPAAPVPATTNVGPDSFALQDNSPFMPEHEALSQLFTEVSGTTHYYSPDPALFPTGQKLLDRLENDGGNLLLAGAERHLASLMGPASDYSEQALWQARYAAAGTATRFVRIEAPLARQRLFDLLLYLAASRNHLHETMTRRVASLIEQAERYGAETPLSEGERYVLSQFRISLIGTPALGSPPEEVMRLSRLIRDGAGFYLVPGEVWTDAVNDWVSHQSQPEQQGWTAILKHALKATTARPSPKWLASATKLIESIGPGAISAAFARWLPLVTQGQSPHTVAMHLRETRGAANVMNDENATCLRGLLWLIPLLPDRESLSREVTSVALSAYKKAPGVGPRAVKVGNAAVYILSELATTDAVGQLAMLKVRVKFGTAQKEIEKAFHLAAESLGLPRDQIEEMGVPSYGLEEVGLRRESLGEYRAEMIVNGSTAELKWFDPQGKALKAAPAKVKKDQAEEFKELQQSLKDVQAMLPAQRDRIDSLFLLQTSWPIETWRERYLLHPLVGTIARKLLWCVDGEPALFVNGLPTGADGATIAHGKTAEITLWHPVGRTVEEIVTWRGRLEELAITQPFKQAHREVYLLTDAERNTHVYSNRYAAHVLRQHQFNALCAARGWKNKLRLMVDDAYPPATKELPRWEMRAEFWIEGIGDDFGTDTNEAGTYLRLASDQVRFYRTGAGQNFAHAGGGRYTSYAGGPGNDGINEPLPLDQIPALVFSEVMRDVDLFVGVASIGNDPTWQDGGPEGRFRDYWHSYSFGELSGTAGTRKQVLERLIPRLKIADRCAFSERFLIVRGTKRTYKIHLGSGNILMEPNDAYLCIVPDASSRAKQDDLFLPFEGDSMLSVILSKALLLADDQKINDPTILSQIEHR